MALEMDKQMRDIEETYKKIQISDPNDNGSNYKPWYYNANGCRDVIELIVAQRKTST